MLLYAELNSKKNIRKFAIYFVSYYCKVIFAS